MRLLLTSDLHFNHRLSRPLAEEVIEEMNRAGGDGVAVLGDTAAGAGDELEQCLSLFRIDGPKLFLAGNHELWGHSGDSYELFCEELPRRVKGLGWQWLESEPLVRPTFAVVGTMGWYDYQFAPPSLGIPRRFYERKISPGAAEHVREFAYLLEQADDISDLGRKTIARWNDGRFIRLGRSDEAFLEEMLARLEGQLARVAQEDATRPVVALFHHLPFAELLPPPHSAQWDFAKAYLGSPRLGEVLRRYPAVRQAFCGHSHMRCQVRIGGVEALSLGSGYRWKTFETLELPE